MRLTSATRAEWAAADTRALLAEGGDLLTPMEANHKTAQGLAVGRYLGRILHLYPAGGVASYLGRRVTVCPWESGCETGCIAFAGRGGIDLAADPIAHPVHRARIRRTLLYYTDRAAFDSRLEAELLRLEITARGRSLTPIARLDGTSDLGIGARIAGDWPAIQLYDYTKSAARMRCYTAGGYAGNYHLTFSRSADNAGACQDVLAAGGNVATVFNVKRGQALPPYFEGWPVIDGDMSDFRFLDPAGGNVVGLRAKGRARGTAGEFVQAP